MDKEIIICVCIHTHTHTHTHTHMHTMEHYSPIKKDKILPFATTWKDLEDIMLSELSQMEEDKYCVIIYMWSLKNKTNIYITKQKQTH